MTTSWLDQEALCSLLDPNGRAQNLFKGFEPRSGQRHMLEQVIAAFNEQKVAFIEAGTGTGKSLAYLLPAIIWSHVSGKKVVIATHTIHLQQQLLHKDVPLASKLLGVTVQAELAKGMNNYLCLKRYHDHQQLPLLQKPDSWQALEQWASSTSTGSKVEWHQTIDPTIWEQVCTDADQCSYQHCPYYESCYFFSARRKLANAHLIITNHHLLCADLASRCSTNGKGLLEDYEAVIIDEAHHLEEVATSNFAHKIEEVELYKLLNKLKNHQPNSWSISLLDSIHKKLVEVPDASRDEIWHQLKMLLEIQIPSEVMSCQKSIYDFFQAVSSFCQQIHPNSEESSAKQWRLPENLTKNNQWIDLVEMYQNYLQDHLKGLRSYLTLLLEYFNEIEHDGFKQKTKVYQPEIESISEKLHQTLKDLKQLIKETENIEKVSWLELRSNHRMLICAQLYIGEKLQQTLYNRMQAVIFCSATLTVSSSFDYLKQRLGFNEQYQEKQVITSSYPSPFDYQKQARVYLVEDLPDPNKPDFLAQASTAILNALEASKGHAFVLFTNYSMLEQARKILSPALQKNGCHVLFQGQKPKHALLQEFQHSKKPVLLGTDSFWEGVDIVGSQLRCVILVKLPFKVPSEPLQQARVEQLKAKGLDSFRHFAVPQAVVKFKQGFGRLIRTQKDFGCVVCLDTRLTSKGWSRWFLDFLPPEIIKKTKRDSLKDEMSSFYKTIPKHGA